MIVNKTMYPISRTFSSITDMHALMDNLQTQLATGKKANSLSELNPDTSYDLTLRSNLNQIDSYSKSIDTANLRLSAMTTAQERIVELRSDAKANATPSSYGTDDTNLAVAPDQANNLMQELVDLLNTDLNGRYLFGGSTTDSAPVASVSDLLDGTDGKDGFKTVASQRYAADKGTVSDPNAVGRLNLSTTGDTVDIAEDGDHPFGFKLSSVTSSGSSAITTTGPSSPAPATESVQFTSVPQAGDKVTMKFTLPDGSDLSFDMTAVDGTPTSDDEFQIGTDAATTAANFQTALFNKLSGESDTSLKAASTLQAANAFFVGAGETAQRVDGPPYDTATGLRDATATDTVQWYGGSSTDPALSSVSTKVSDSTTVNYGVEANQAGYTNLMRNLASMAVQTFNSTDDTDHAVYDALATRSKASLANASGGTDGSLEVITTQLGLAQTTLSRTSDRHIAYQGQLETMLSDLETAPIEEVSAKILALQTQLQASYQVMSNVSQLSLVNYL